MAASADTWACTGGGAGGELLSHVWAERGPRSLEGCGWTLGRSPASLDSADHINFPSFAGAHGVPGGALGLFQGGLALGPVCEGLGAACLSIQQIHVD